MKWYKKQMDQLKLSKPKVSENNRPADAKSPRHSFGAANMVIKKISKPGEKRARPKTDSTPL